MKDWSDAMSDFSMTTQNSQNKEPVWSVSDVNRAMREMVENGFRSFWMTGEVGSLILHRSGHAYFSLKDERSQIRACWFGGVNEMRKLGIENGTKIEVFGSLSVYETRGEYQFNCRQARIAGVGDLYRKFEELAKKLAAEGLFAQERKKPVPKMPGTIGVVTSSNGAAIRDFLNIAGRRFSGLNIKIYPCQVQGSTAAESVARGVEFFNRANNVEVIIVTRGGGSMEDLWCFNEERLVRAVAASNIPVISAVGHEIDTTICDYAADLRVPTPSAAAELITGDRENVAKHLDQLNFALQRNVEFAISRNQSKLNEMLHRLREPERMLSNFRQRIDELDSSMQIRSMDFLHTKKLDVEKFSVKLDALDPRKMLNNGYVFVAESATGKPVTTSRKVPGTKLDLTFADGVMQVKVDGKNSKNNSKSADTATQGELF
ncbi:MAG: exodeoxyribonuclease VII large subunit [Lentisphaerae bacterium]|nr:exodeoxyribonuclease VII large subunit [Lentisphaerota bacterium]